MKQIFHKNNVAGKIFYYHICDMQTKTYTPGQFATKTGLSRATIWRWTTNKKLENRLKMYDARKILVAGRIFIEQDIVKKKA